MATPKQVMDFRPSKGITTISFVLLASLFYPTNAVGRKRVGDPLNQQATTTAAVSGSTSRFGAARFVL